MSPSNPPCVEVYSALHPAGIHPRNAVEATICTALCCENVSTVVISLTYQHRFTQDTTKQAP